MSKSLATKNVAAILVACALVFGFAFAFATPAKADMLSDLQAQVQALLAQIASLQGSSSTTTSGAGCYTFTRNHQQGDKGGEVMWVQKFLNTHGAQVAASGAGSSGNETDSFGGLTKAAVAKFQAANGVSPAAGYWGPMTRAKANALCAGSTTTPTTPVPTGPGLSVMAGVQPANSLAPQGAARVPFTSFSITNNSGAAVTVNGVTVQRSGLAQDAAFSGIVLVDSNNVQLGTSKTLNSNHQATIGDTFTIQPGQTISLTVSANMASSLSSYAGQVAGLSVVGINTTVPVSGSLPITGASQTLNATLSLGSVSTTTSAFDPGVATTKNIGDTGIKFSGIKFTAGSTEDLKLYSIRFRQVGSVSSSDLANVVIIANGTSYPTTVDSTGKYYTAVFPGGLLIAKGNSADIYIQGDIVGSNASSRTVDFDLDKVTDVYFVGQLYGYGIAPSGTYTPWYNGYVVTLSGASVTTIGKDTSSANAAQNIAVNVVNQPLGGYIVDLKGEPISVQSQVFTVATTTASSGLLQTVSIVNENGAIVAGPVDATWVSGTQTLTFTDTVTYPLGRHTYSLRGKVPSCSSCNGQTIAISTTPSSGWTNITGQTTGNSVSLSGSSAFTMNTMTVKSGSLAVAISATPAAQNIVAGSQGFTFANVQLDATQSGEDVRLNSFAMTLDNDNGSLAGAASKLSSCQVYDGASALNGGSNTVNPSDTATTSATTATFTLDNSLTIAKGTVKTLAVKCNLATTAHTSSTFQWGITSTQIGAIAATGVSSGSSITPTGSTNSGQVMTTASTGSVVVSTDASSPSYALAAANSTGVTAGVFKFRATNEAVNLARIGLQLTNTASSSASDLVQVSLWSGATQIGTATFVGSNTNATSTLTSPLVLARDTDVTVTVKIDVAAMGTSQPATAGHLIAVDVDTNSTNTQGTGAQSGATVNASGSTAVAGVRIFKSFPTIANDSSTLGSTGIADGKLMRFKVTADSHGDVGISKFTLTIATTTATVTTVNIRAYTDSSYSTPVSGLSSDGSMLATSLAGTAWASSSTQLEFYAQTSAAASTTIQIPAGTTRYFEVSGSVSGATSGASIATTIQGDAAYPSLSGFLTTAALVDGDTNDDMIWSPNTTGTAAVTDSQWTNGFGVLGLPSGGLINTRGQ